MLRKVIQADQEYISLRLPEHFIGKKIEVIVFTTDEVDELENAADVSLTHFASESVLANDWLKPEEDEAWKNL